MIDIADNDNSDGRQTFRERSVDTDLLVAALEKVPVGKTITYEELSRIIKRDVRETATHNLASARRIIQKEKRYVFGTITGIGLKRLNDSEIANSTTDTIKRIRRMVGRGARRLSCAVYENLKNEERIRFNTDASVLGALAHISQKQTVKKVESRVVECHEKLALAETLGMFGKSKT